MGDIFVHQMKSVLLLLAFAAAVALAVPPNWSNRRAACEDGKYAAADCKCGTGADGACKKNSKCTTNLFCAPDACTKDNVLNAACTCGTTAGCAKDNVCFGGTKCYKACASTDGSTADATDGAGCACGTTEVAKGKFCQVVAKKGYVTDSVKCKKSDASAKEDPACTCGYKSGGVAIAKDEYCFVLADGTGNSVNVACKKTDASAAEDPACNCGGDAGIVAVAKDKFCQVVAKKGYVTDSVKCKKSDASAKEDAACTCGYKAGAVVDVAVGEFCSEATDGTGYKYTAPACTKTDGVTTTKTDCMCGSNKLAINVQPLAKIAAGGTTCAAH